MLGIYIHIPFCAKKCPYCDFYSGKYSKSIAREYCSAVVRNLHYYASYGHQADTLYFGGGTPSLMDVDSLESIISTAKKLYNMPSNSEITLEVNPRTVTPKKLESLYKIGINRLSIGVQSCVDSELVILGRNHTFEDCFKLVSIAKSIGFENISCDLMVGTPSQTMDTLKYSCENLASLDIQHISSYMLKLEDGTPYSLDTSILSQLPDDDLVCDMYLKSVEIFESYGYMQYEVSNFAKLGFESRHNLKYWQCVDYLGIGASSHSCFEGKRFLVPTDREKFILDEHQTTVLTESSPYTFEEVGMLSLRLTSGLNTRLYPQYAEKVLKRAKPLETCGYLTIHNGVVSLTPRGFLVSNSIIEELVL